MMRNKRCLNKKGQGLVNKERDAIHNYKCVQMNHDNWYVRCFDNENNHNEKEVWPWTETTVKY